MEATVELAARPKSAGDARRFAGDVLAEWQVPTDTCDVVVLLVSELVTNAILHAGLDFRMTIRQETSSRLRVEVHDLSPAPVQPRHFTTEAGTGRGFMLIEALAVDWGWQATDEGKMVWFEVSSG